jgi:hypothetical protein
VTKAILEEAAKDLDLRLALSPVEIPRPAEVSPVVPEPPLVAAAANGVSHNAANGHAVSEPRMPLENYQSRQKSLSFFANLMERWR